jgi:hypothetical protein
VLTRQEIARRASAASARAARARRFARYAEEIKQNPEDLDVLTKLRLAEALNDAGGWRVLEDH